MRTNLLIPDIPYFLKTYPDLRNAHSQYHTMLDLIRGNRMVTGGDLRKNHPGLDILFKDYHAILRKYKQKYNVY